MVEENKPHGEGQGPPSAPSPPAGPPVTPPPTAPPPPPGYPYSRTPPLGLTLKDVTSFINISRIFFLLGTIVLFIVAIYSIIASVLLFAVGDIVSAGGSLAAGSVDIVLGIIAILGFTRTKDILNLVESGNYADASHQALIWGVLGLFSALIIGGVLLILTYVRLREAAHYAAPQPTPTQPA
ncbi:MAG: hypothetical protein QXT63_05455 [Thermoplasmata archaeon]